MGVSELLPNNKGMGECEASWTRPRQTPAPHRRSHAAERESESVQVRWLGVHVQPPVAEVHARLDLVHLKYVQYVAKCRWWSRAGRPSP